MTFLMLVSSYHFYLFADETNIYFEATDLVSLQKIMNQEMKYAKNGLMIINMSQ